MIYDKSSCNRYLIDTGAEVSVFPATQKDKHRGNSDFALYADNASTVSTCGTKIIKLNLGLRRTFTQTFIIADVTVPIIGADFLSRYGLLVDNKRKRQLDLDPFTFLSSLCSISNISVNTLSLTCIDYNSVAPEIVSLLMEFKEITSVSSTVPKQIKHLVTHCIETRGPPVSAKTRRFSPEKFRIAKNGVHGIARHM